MAVMDGSKGLMNVANTSDSVTELEVFSENSFRGKPVISCCDACKEDFSEDLLFVFLTDRQLKNSSRYKNLIALLNLGYVVALPCLDCGYLNQFVYLKINPETGVIYTKSEIQAIITDFIRSASY